MLVELDLISPSAVAPTAQKTLYKLRLSAAYANRSEQPTREFTFDSP